MAADTRSSVSLQTQVWWHDAHMRSSAIWILNAISVITEARQLCISVVDMLTTCHAEPTSLG